MMDGTKTLLTARYDKLVELKKKTENNESLNFFDRCIIFDIKPLNAILIIAVSSITFVIPLIFLILIMVKTSEFEAYPDNFIKEAKEELENIK